MVWVGKTKSCRIIKDFVKKDKTLRKRYHVPFSCSKLPGSCSRKVVEHIGRAYYGGQLYHFLLGINQSNKATYTGGEFSGQPVLTTIYREICDFISRIIGGNMVNQEVFDREFDRLCSNLCGSYQGVTTNGRKVKGMVRYGAVQKVVNLTLKYLYVEHYLGNVNIPDNAYDYFHCPIDANALWMLSCIYKNSSYFSGITGSATGTMYWNGKPWSRFDRDDYWRLLSSMRNVLINGTTLLELDFLLWFPGSGWEKGVQAEFCCC